MATFCGMPTSTIGKRKGGPGWFREFLIHLPNFFKGPSVPKHTHIGYLNESLREEQESAL